MDDEFALCWNNFQDNIASGFQNLYDRGDLVDVTLACDGKLLHAHKIVLAICSPYFQEIFISNPCKHPIIILKDVTVGVMCELLQFMYQGVVNVKHTELQAFMKIAQLLQIKGLASNTSAPPKSPNQLQNANASQSAATSSAGGSGTNSTHKHSANSETNNGNDSKANIPPPSSSSSTSSPSPMQFSHIKSPPENPNPFQTGPGLKRLPEYSTESLSIYSRNKYRRNTDSSDHDMGPDSLDNVNQEDNFLSTIPHISMVESRFDINNVKRENSDHSTSSSSLRNTLPPHFGFDYNLYKNNPEYPNDLHIPNDYSKSFSNHMDIPPSGGNVTMLSSTSLLHANCVFNRNNTVATQQGMKTYWLCKSYRISMCRARCITHQGRVISATGVHNHPPHMRNVGGGLEMMPPQQNNPNLMVPNNAGNLMQIPTTNTNLNSTLSNIRIQQGATNLSQHNLAVMNHQQQQSTQPQPPHHHHLPQGLPSNSSHHQIHQNVPSHHHHPSQHVSSHTQSSVIQNMMHNVNLMHLSNMAPMLNTLPSQHSPQINALHSQQQQPHHHQSHHQIPQPPSSLEITPILTESPCISSPSNRSSHPSQGETLDSPMHSTGPNASSSGALNSPSQGSEGNASSHGPDGNPSLVPNPSGSPDDISNNCQDSHNSSQHSHIISSITISPGNTHNFKIENM